jgi:serine/threonine-protein kinase
MAMTQQGLVLGTAGYMAPEQASGQGSDQRADVWAFGVVLYEMLTGLPVFKGESVPHVLADVLKTEPDWSRLPKNLHPRVRHLLERCLTKKPRSRWHSIADARIEIEAALGDPRGVTPGPSGSAAERQSSNVLRLAAMAVVAAGIAGAAVWLLRPMPTPAPEPKPVVRFSIPLPAPLSFPGDSVSMLAVSPDGKHIAYSSGGEIFLRNIGEREARPVQGTAETGAGPFTPVFSPDGQWLAYVHVQSAVGPYRVKRVPIAGGAPSTIHEANNPSNFPHGLSWPTADDVLFTNADGIVRVSVNGGMPDVLIARAQGERLFSPQLLPDGESVLFTRAPGDPGAFGGIEAPQVVVQSIGADDRTVVRERGSAGRYLPTGHLVYADGTALFAIPFDPQSRTVRGGAVPMVDALRRSGNAFSDAAYFAVSETGTLVTVPPNVGSDGGVERTLTWVDRNGREEPFPVRPDDYSMVRISPDGKKVALVLGAAMVTNARLAIWIFDLTTETLSSLTAHPDGDDGPVWSTDSSRIFFRSARDSPPMGVYAIGVDTGETTPLAASPDFPIVMPWTVSPDDRTLGLLTVGADSAFDVIALSLEGGGEYVPLLHEATDENQPAFSPNGAWIAYQEGAVEDGTAEISIRPYPDVSRRKFPVGPGRAPVFSRDGSELFYLDGEGLWAAPITYEPTLRVGTPQRLFETTGYFLDAPGRAWDVDPSGERFLMIRLPTSESGELPTERIDVVVNWFEELESRVPVD